MKTLNYGILSTASIVPRFINALRTVDGAKLVAIGSRDIEKAQSLASKYDVPKAYGSYEEVLQDSDIDVVYICMINSLHYTYAKKALAAGKHVICEKPFTLSSQEAMELYDEARKRNLFITEAVKTFFLPIYQDISSLIDSGKLGMVHMADFTNSYAPGYNNWILSKEAGGGALTCNACYIISVLQLLFGTITAYNGISTYGDSQVDEQCALSFQLGKDILATGKISIKVEGLNRLLIFADKGHIEIPNYWKSSKAIVHYKDDHETVIDHPCDYELKYELQHYHECILQGLTASPISSPERTLEAIRIVEALR